jgi:hypothetical protein
MVKNVKPKPKRVPARWKYKNGRKIMPKESREDVMIYLFAMLLECADQMELLREKILGANRELFIGKFNHFMTIFEFLEMRFKQGTSTIEKKRFEKAELMAKNYLATFKQKG